MSTSIPDNPSSLVYQDVVDCILDCFATLPQDAANQRMLSVCSLVCRAWVDHSQKLLLHTIILEGRERINTFISALPSFSDRARHFIRDVCMCGPLILNNVDPPQFPTIGLAEVFSLLKGLPRLDHLHLTRLQLSHIEAKSNIQWRGSLRSLTFNDVVDTAFSYPPMAEISLFASMFQFVDKFVISYNPFQTQFLKEASIAAAVPLNFPNLHSLFLEGSAVVVSLSLRLLHITKYSQKPRAIFISAIDTSVAEALQELLVDDPISIQSLAVSFNIPSENAYANSTSLDPKWWIDTSLLINLRELRFTFKFPLETGLGDIRISLWQQLLAFLSYFSTAPVETIHFSVFILSEHSPSIDLALNMLRQFSWSPINVALRRCSTLKTACITVIYNDPDGSVSAARRYLGSIAQDMSCLHSEEGHSNVQLEWMRHDQSGWPVMVDWKSLQQA